MFDPQAILDPNVPEDREYLWKYFNIELTVLKMMMNTISFVGSVYHLHHRGDKFVSENASEIFQLLTMDFEQFLVYRAQKDIFRNRYEFSTMWIDNNPKNPGKITMLLFLPSQPGSDVDINTYRTYVEYLYMINPTKVQAQMNPYQHFILLTENRLGSSATGLMNESRGIDFEVYPDDLFAFDPTEHCLAPIRVTRILAENATVFCETEGFDQKQLPAAHKNDPIAAMYGAKVGDILLQEVMGCSHDKKIEYRTIIPELKFQALKK